MQGRQYIAPHHRRLGGLRPGPAGRRALGKVRPLDGRGLGRPQLARRQDLRLRGRLRQLGLRVRLRSQHVRRARARDRRGAQLGEVPRPDALREGAGEAAGGRCDPGERAGCRGGAGPARGFVLLLREVLLPVGKEVLIGRGGGRVGP